MQPNDMNNLFDSGIGENDDYYFSSKVQNDSFHASDLNQTFPNDQQVLTLIDYDKIFQLLNVTNSTNDSMEIAIMELVRDLDEFTRFHSTLNELADVVAYLPLNECNHPNETESNHTDTASKKKPTNGGLVTIYESLRPIFCPNDEIPKKPPSTTTETPTGKWIIFFLFMN